ncbi:MAG: MFS transporter [Alphaproteobacteria bacterium]
MSANAEARYDSEVQANLKRNYLSLLAHGVFGMTGFRLLNAPTFLPAYIFLLSESNLVVGLIVAAQHVGSALAALPGGNLIAHRKRVLPLFLIVGGMMRIQILGIALAGLLLPEAWALKATALFLLLFGMFSGMQGVSFNFTVSKLVPVRVRGRLMGFRNFMAGFVSAAIAYLGGTYFIDNNIWGNGYATTFLMAFVLTAIGLLCLLWMREPEPPSVQAPAKLASRLKGVPDLIRKSPGFARYVGAVSLATLSMAAVPFYILYAGEKTELTGREIGLLTVAFMLVQTLSTPLWGYLADHAGNKLVFVSAIAVWAASLILMLSVDADWVLYAVFSGVGVGLGGFMIGSQNILLEFGDRHALPMLIAAASTATSLTAATGPILAGLFVSAFPYETLFVIAIGMKITAVIITLFFVREPRRRSG